MGKGDGSVRLSARRVHALRARQRAGAELRITPDGEPAPGNPFAGREGAPRDLLTRLEGERVVGEERLLADRSRIRDVRVGPDGVVYVLTDELKGELLALVRR